MWDPVAEEHAMKILVLQGSPRPNGNTQAVLNPVVEAAKEAGAEVEIVQLRDLKNLTGCQECYECQEVPDDPGCAIQDDMLAVIGKTLKADVIVWATPVLCWSVAWPLKIAMDRFSCLFKFHQGGEVRCLVKGRKMAAVITAANSQTGGGDLATEVCWRIAKHCENDWLGALVVGHDAAPDAVQIDPDLARRARTFGQKLASGTSAVCV